MGTYIGHRVRVSTREGKYEGTVQSVDLHNRRISVEKVYSCSREKKLSGLCHFFGTEIEDIEFLEENLVKTENLLDEDEGPSILQKKQAPKHLATKKDLDVKQLYLRQRVEQGVSREKDVNSTVGDGDKPTLKLVATQLLQFPPIEEEVDLSGQRPKHFVIIYKIDAQFKEVIAYIKEQRIIGFSIEGIKLGRCGKLCWIQIATREMVFLFDMLKLGRQTFEQGLADILENPDVQKVIHDSRLASDMLYHQFTVKLVNVFDTQVADVMVYRIMNGGVMPKFVAAQHVSLFKHLELKQDEVFIGRNRKYALEDDQAIFAERPAPTEVLDALVKNVIYLRELRVVLNQKMLYDFVEGVDIYLRTLRDKPEESVADATKNCHMLPLGFKNFLCERQPRGKHISNYERDEHGFELNCGGVMDPLISYSKTCPWRAANSDASVMFPDSTRRRSAPPLGNKPRGVSRDQGKSQEGCPSARGRSKGRCNEKVDTVIGLGQAEKLLSDDSPSPPLPRRAQTGTVQRAVDPIPPKQEMKGKFVIVASGIESSGRPSQKLQKALDQERLNMLQGNNGDLKIANNTHHFSDEEFDIVKSSVYSNAASANRGISSSVSNKTSGRDQHTDNSVISNDHNIGVFDANYPTASCDAYRSPSPPSAHMTAVQNIPQLEAVSPPNLTQQCASHSKETIAVLEPSTPPKPQRFSHHRDLTDVPPLEVMSSGSSLVSDQLGHKPAVNGVSPIQKVLQTLRSPARKSSTDKESSAAAEKDLLKDMHGDTKVPSVAEFKRGLSPRSGMRGVNGSCKLNLRGHSRGANLRALSREVSDQSGIDEVSDESDIGSAQSPLKSGWGRASVLARNTNYCS